MRTPEDIRRAQETYNNNLIETELSALPEGYIAGGNIIIDGTDVYVSPFIANVRGKRVAKKSKTNIMDMDWEVLKTDSTYFHIYLNRYGFWFVDTNEPITIDGLYGLYRKESNELYMGTVYVNSSGSFSKVISWRKIRAEDLDAETITANEIDAETITANEIDADTLQAQFLKVTGAVTIGYEGTGTIDSPDEGDRRVYIDGDEISFVEYTNGAWSTVNQIRLGGVDSNSLFYPFLQCRGVVNPSADEISQEFFPSSDYYVYNFENNFEDQNGLVGWGVTADYAFSSSIKKFGSYSLGATAGNSSISDYGVFEWTAGGSSTAVGVWVYLSDKTNISDNFSAIVTLSSINDTLGIGLKTGFLPVIAYAQNTATYSYLASIKEVQLNTWEYLGLVYNNTTKVLTLIHNDETYTVTLSDTWNGDVVNPLVFTTNNDDSNHDFILNIDELIFSVNDNLNSDIFIQHYNHNQPWNTDYSAKDLILKPADGGRVVIDDNQTEVSLGTLHMFTSANKKTSITLPRASISANNPATLDLSSYIPSGAKAVLLNARPKFYGSEVVAGLMMWPANETVTNWEDIDIFLWLDRSTSATAWNTVHFDSQICRVDANRKVKWFLGSELTTVAGDDAVIQVRGYYL